MSTSLIMRISTRIAVAVLGALSMMPSARADIADSIVAGSVTNCAIIRGGELRCWGSNSAGMLGSGLADQQLGSSPFPTAVVDAAGRPLRDVISVSLGANGDGADSHACAVTADQGHVLCWGRNFDQYLNVGSADISIHDARPVIRNGQPLTGLISVAAGTRFTCAVDVDGQVLCWGQKGPWLGDGTSDEVSSYDAMPPAYVLGPGGVGRLDNVANIVAGERHACARQLGGKVWCWGSDDYNQLGTGSGQNNTTVPRPLLGAGVAGSLHQVARITAGANHNCVVAKATAQSRFQAFCWGRNDYGQLGANVSGQTQVGRPNVVRRAGGGVLEGVTRLSAGYNHTCAVTGGDFLPTAVHCWGRSQRGNLGPNVTGNTSYVAVEVPETLAGAPVLRVGDIAAGGSHGCVRSYAGGVRCWGENTQAQLGRHLGEAVWHTPVPAPDAFVHRLDGVVGPADRIFGSGLQFAGR